jgi:hypothetical protein
MNTVLALNRLCGLVVRVIDYRLCTNAVMAACNSTKRSTHTNNHNIIFPIYDVFKIMISVWSFV